jgi:hypothetical protein
MSRDTAYRLRRRDALFARGWDAALLLARDSVAQTLGDRALDGIEEDVWHRGELMGTRRRYDTRLLLAHMARLDKLAEQQAGFGDAERFDEIVGCIAGEPVPAEFDCEPATCRLTATTISPRRPPRPSGASTRSGRTQPTTMASWMTKPMPGSRPSATPR